MIKIGKWNKQLKRPCPLNSHEHASARLYTKQLYKARQKKSLFRVSRLILEYGPNPNLKKPKHFPLKTHWKRS